MNSCSTCKRAYKAQNSDYVVCGYWHNKYIESKQTIEDYQCEIPYNLNLALGWGSLVVPVVGVESWVTKGTATSGIIYKDLLCIQKDCCCRHYIG